MTQKLELYRCNICKNIVEVVLEGDGTLVCCGEKMELLKPGTTDGENMPLGEKHVPVIDFECESAGVKIRVGEFPHPMIPEHYIQFIEAISKSKKTIHREYLYPGEAPQININCRSNLGKGDGLQAREYCNIHGLFATMEENNNEDG